MAMDVGYRSKTPFMEGELADGRLIAELPLDLLERPLLWTRLGANQEYEAKQVVFTKVGDALYLEQRRVWSETGIWIPLEGNPSLEKRVLGIVPILDTTERGYRIDLTDVLFDDGVVWKNRSGGNKVTALTTVMAFWNREGELIVKTHLGLEHKGVRRAQPVYFSFYGLPQPMEPRRFDYRMGFWDDTKSGIPDPLTNIEGGIARWRLEKKHRDSVVSLPVRPITFILSPDIPEQWRPYVKAGVEEWLPAFESAGFRDALVVQEVDSLEEWQRYGLGHSIIRWSGNQNVRRVEHPTGGSTITSVMDQRSGEILKADILMSISYAHYMDEYFIRCAALDPRARSYPFPDALLGSLIQSVVAHELGHALGIKDNHYGEFSYPLEKMGDVAWLETMGHTPSIMTYGRHNGLAQPEDSVPPRLLVQKVGPTDHYYIQWGYSEFPDGMTEAEQSKALEGVIRRQDTVPWYRFNNLKGETIGPGATNELVETNDPVGGVRLALKNLQYAIELMPHVNRDQKDHARLQRMYGEALEYWFYAMKQVMSLIGGYDIHYKSLDQTGHVYSPIAWESQMEALDFLLDQAFDPPKWLTRPSFLDRIRYTNYPDRLLSYRQLLVFDLLGPKRLKRFEHLETLSGYDGAMVAYLVRLQQGLFRELEEGSGKVSPDRQELQQTYIDRMVLAIQQERKHFEADKKAFDYTDYAKGRMMDRLMDLKKRLERELRRQREGSSTGHWQSCLVKLKGLMGS